jgi:hypothetical protein
MRVKEQLQKTQEKEDALDWSFAEWLEYFTNEPTSKELDAMEKDSKHTSINNPNYYPLQGA